jgi:hypothetical protein
MKLKNSAKKFAKKAKLKEFIINEIQTLPDYDKELKFDNEIIEAVLQTVEDKLYASNDDDKKEFAICILKQLFNLSNDEVAIILKSITYILENKMIKKHSKMYKYGAAIAAFFLKRLGVE